MSKWLTNYPRQEDLSCLLIFPPIVSYIYPLKIQPDENFILWLHYMADKFMYPVTSGSPGTTGPAKVVPMVYFENLRLDTILELFQ